MNTRTMSRCLLAFLLLCSPLRASMAWAQSDPKAAAHEHYEKGLAAFDEERFNDAAEEFEAAYRISPAFAVLYNIGRVNVALGRSVEAVQAFEKYLAQGAASIAAGRRQEVRAEIDKQRSRIGSLMVRTVPDSADLRVDGKLIGKTPLAQPLLVTAGRHTIEALLSGYTPQVRELEVGGMAQIDIDLRLEAVVGPGAGNPSTPPPSPVSAPAPAAAIPPVQVAPTPVQIVLAPAPATPPTYSASASEVGGSSNAMRMWGYAVAAAGLVAGGAGVVIAVTGVSAASDARDRAASATAPTPTAQAQYDQASSDFEAAKNQTQLGWIVAGVGGGVLLAGVLLVVISPDHKTSAGLPRVAPWMTANGGGIAAAGAW
jgi:tetratricopeptide (TPR) repeat protein